MLLRENSHQVSQSKFEKDPLLKMGSVAICDLNLKKINIDSEEESIRLRQEHRR